MPTSKNIRGIKDLDNEISKLNAGIKMNADKLNENLEYLQENFGKLLIHSLKEKNHHDLKSENFWTTALKNSGVNAVVNKITTHLAERTVDSIDGLVDKIFQKKKE